MNADTPNAQPAPDPPHLWFHGGTLVLEGYGESAPALLIIAGLVFRWRLWPRSTVSP